MEKGVISMEKIFLSHSSKNKDYVRPIFEYFGKDRSVFDEMTFEYGMKTIDEIFSGIDSSDIFDIFYIGEGETQYRPLLDLYKKSLQSAQDCRRTDRRQSQSDNPSPCHMHETGFVKGPRFEECSYNTFHIVW